MKQYNRLRKKQKEAVLSWIAEGLETGEINERAAKFKPTFEVSAAQVDYYRATRDADLRALARASETQALSSGYALKEQRVLALQKIAELMYRDITGGFLWLDQAKSLGSGDNAVIMDYEEFNTAEVQQLRGVFDDIAKEVGHRKEKLELSGSVSLTKSYVTISPDEWDQTDSDIQTAAVADSAVARQVASPATDR